ncbi:hypothetical protein [Luteolibacter sp. Populi]|uniref:hypothetical protein n=1 Tax=Luteolibacter sp. Populi TaxID=3230487 RepID=UPI003467B727
MKAPRSLKLPASVFALCAIAGWLAGRMNPAHDQVDGNLAAGSKAAKTVRGKSKSSVPSEVLAMLAPVRTAQTTGERLRATIQLAGDIPVADIEKWLSARWFDGSEDMQESLFTRTLLSRWQEEDPAGMLAFCLRKEIRIAYEFAGDWARRDPVAALACIGQEKDPQTRSRMLAYMGNPLAKADPQAVAARIGDLFAAVGPEQANQVSGMIRALASSSPELLKAEALKWPKLLQDAARNGLAGASLKKDLVRGLAELGRQEDGKRVFMEVAGDDSELMKSIGRDLGSLPPGWLGDLVSRGGGASYYLVQDDPGKWLDSDLAAIGLNENQARQLRNSALSQLASKDPEKLKSLLAGQELGKQERSGAIQYLVARLDKDQAEAWMAGLSDEGDRDAAKAAFAFRSQDDGNSITPAGLLSDLAETGRDLSWAESSVTGRWGREQMQVLNDGFDALPADKKALIAGKFITNNQRGIPMEFKAKALDYLLANPPAASSGEPPREQNGGQRRDPLAVAACDIAVIWVEKDSTAAADWVTGLPSGNERLWAAKNLAARWAEYEPSAASRWIAALPAGERSEVEKFMKEGR